MTIRIRLTRLPHGEGLPLPSYATHGAAGMDVVAAENFDLEPGHRPVAEVPLARGQAPVAPQVRGSPG